MTDQPAPDFLDAIRKGIDASGRALLAETRRSGQPRVTWRDGHVVLVDADGKPVTGQAEKTAS
jgi:hypothetical protein